MRLLFLLPESPCPERCGPHVHNTSLLKLACEWADCGVIGFWRGAEGLSRWESFAKEFPQVAVHGVFPENAGITCTWHRFKALFTGCPLGLGNFVNLGANSAIKRVIAAHRYDVSIIAFHQLLNLREAASQAPIVLIPFDAHSMAYQRGYRSRVSPFDKVRLYLSYLAFRHMEKRCYRQFTLVAPVSDVDCRWLRDGCPSIPLRELPIAVEGRYFEQRRKSDAPGKPVHLVCGGVSTTTSISNAIVDFVVDNYPQLKQEHPQLRTTIWGRGVVPGKLQRCLAKHPEIRSLTWADDYLQAVAETDIYLYPQQFGSGIQTKVQHMMAAGVPVVARWETLEPLGAQHGKSAFLFDSVASLHTALSLLIARPELRQSVGWEGRERMLAKYSMPAVACVFKSMLTGIVGQCQENSNSQGS